MIKDLPVPPLGLRFDEALVYARQLHQAQVRKGTVIPYFAHLMAVSAIVLEYGGDEDQAIAGLLHDAMEDQGGVETLADIGKKFGAVVAAIVEDCTDAWTEPKPPWQERKERYVASLAHKPKRSLLVSAADKLHNCRSIAADYAILGEDLWQRFTGARDGTLWYYRALADAFGCQLPSPLSDALEREVSGLLRRVREGG